MPMLPLRVFVSSPDDVADERRCAKEVIERLSGIELLGWRVTLEPMLWETDSPPVVGQKAQQAIDYYFGKAGDTDIYVGLLWTTLGSSVILNHRRYDSGTLYEFEDAYCRSRSIGRPTMLMYHCQRPTTADPAGVAAVNQFFASFRGEFPAYEGNPLAFQKTEQFTQRLETDLRRILPKIVERHIANEAAVREPSSASSPPELGRGVLLRELIRFLRNYDDIFGEGREHEDSFPVHFARVDDGAKGPSHVQPSSSLLDVYESAGRRVLFLGEAGTGKTFTMLRLMQQLLDRAKNRTELPLPVYLNLASWSPLSGGRKSRGGLASAFRVATNGQDNGIDAWVVDELVRRYSIPRRAAAHLVANRQMIFCLDGLDEIGHRADENVAHDVDEPMRLVWQNECLRSINRLLEDRSVQLILCGRRSLLAQLDTRLDVPCRLHIEPLDPAMCETYLRRWANLDGLRAALTQSPALAGWIQNPLFLRMMSVAYRDMHAEAIVAAASKPEFEWQSHLIDNYIGHCLSLIPNSTRAYFSSQAPRYLSWFAAHAEADFLLEDLQPSMLFDPPRLSEPSLELANGQATGAASTELETLEDAAPGYRRYRWTSNVLLALLLALCTATSLGLGIGVEWSATRGAVAGTLHGLLLTGTALALTFLFALPAFASERWWVFGGLLGAGFAIVRGFTVGLSSPDAALGGSAAEGLWAALGTWPCTTVVFCLLGYQMFSALREHRWRYRSKAGIRWYEIQPLESLDWRWIDQRSRLRGGWVGLVVGPAAAAFLWSLFGASRGLAFGYLITVFVCMFNGFLGTGIRVSLEPNQGIVRSCQHALLTAFWFTSGSVIVCAIAYGAMHGALSGVVNGLLGLAASLVFLAFGGIPVVRHVCLGHALHQRRALPSWWGWYPWTPTVHFLEDMVRYKLLRRTAGGYSFRHGLVRDYFIRLWHERFAGDRRETTDGSPRT